MSKLLKTYEVVDLLQIMFDLCLKRKTAVLTKMGISETEYNFFMFLDKNNKLSVMQIANQMSLAQPKVSRMTDKLMKKGYLQRESQERDLRSFKISFTDKGEKMHAYAVENKCMGETRIKDILKEEKYKEFKSLLHELIDNYTI